MVWTLRLCALSWALWLLLKVYFSLFLPLSFILRLQEWQWLFFSTACPGTGVRSKRKLPNLGLLFCCCFCLLVFILWFEEAHLGILRDYFRLYTQELLLAAFQGPYGLLEIEPKSTACKSVITLWTNLCFLIKCLHICPLYLSLWLSTPRIGKVENYWRERRWEYRTWGKVLPGSVIFWYCIWSPGYH